MNKNKLIAGALALMAMPVFAQSQPAQNRKWACELDYLIQQPVSNVMNTVSPLSLDQNGLISLSVEVTDAQAVVDYVNNQGYEAEMMNDESVVVTIPAKFIPELSSLDEVNYVFAPMQFYPLMKDVRDEVKVSKVLSGEGLDSPLAAADDVIVGVIDRGFEFEHPAFKDRVVKYGISPMSGTTSSKMPVKDETDDNGHATHVTNIAAGSPVEGYDCHGIATGADLMLMPSSFQDAAIKKQAKAIKNYAEKLGKPWVINMSFGGVVGAHDGSTQYDQDMDKLCGEGAIMVAAMGNERGLNLHAKRTITEDDQKVYVHLKTGEWDSQKNVYSQVWAEKNDGISHLDIKLCVAYNGQLYYPTKSEIQKAQLQLIESIDYRNQRQYASCMGSVAALLQQLKIPAYKTSYLLWEVSGKKDNTFHVWTEHRWGGSIEACETAGIVAEAGDDDYLVGQGAASIPSSIAVASYNIRDTYRGMNGLMQGFPEGFLGVKDDMSAFSSKGPSHSDDLKPAVAAPGGAIISAYSKNAADFSKTNTALTKKVTVDDKDYYYGVMSGTSMATPVVTGIVALWLQANPKLTPAQIMSIIKKTSRNDNYTGKDDENGWNASAGYGKIDAYEGLKEALKMANESGINEVLNTEEPVSLMKSDNNWKVLFNNDESYANVHVYAINGKMVYNAQLESPRRGEEHVISLAGFEPGMYLFHVDTKLGTVTRKMLVK